MNDALVRGDRIRYYAEHSRQEMLGRLFANTGESGNVGGRVEAAT